MLACLNCGSQFTPGRGRVYIFLCKGKLPLAYAGPLPVLSPCLFGPQTLRRLNECETYC